MRLKSIIPIATLLGCAAMTLHGYPTVPPASAIGIENSQPPWVRPLSSSETPPSNTLDIRWLGTAGFEIRSARSAILIDPYFSRLPILRLLTGRIKPDLLAIKRELHPAQAVFVSHGHVDHLLDAPEIAKELACPLYTSSQGEKLALSEGLPDKLCKPVKNGTTVNFGDFSVEAVDSHHSEIITQWLVGGDMTAAPIFPMTFLDYKNGPTYGFFIHWRGRTIYHNGTAQIVEQAINHRHADVVLMCVTGWTASNAIWERVGKALTPDVIVPMHDDDFFKPMSEGFIENPLARRKEALETIRRVMPRSHVMTVKFHEGIRLTASEGSAKGAAAVQLRQTLAETQESNR